MASLFGAQGCGEIIKTDVSATAILLKTAQNTILTNKQTNTHKLLNTTDIFQLLLAKNINLSHI